MKDIEAYIFITFHAPRFNMKKATLMDYLNTQELVPIGLNHSQIESILLYPPSIKHIIWGLKEQGFQVKFIAEYLNLPQPNVSYHIKNPPKEDWRCPILVSLRHTQAAELRYREEHGIQY
jgi:DNA-binding MarR family transcriptional regulator